MKRGHDYEWDGIRVDGNSRDFICDYCGSDVSSREEFRGWKRSNNSNQAWHIYICHSCGKPNFFDIDGEQSPIIYNLKENFPNHVKGISPEFVDIYNQALSAEKLGFDKIAGPGFRRALEFLVKDFLINQIPEDSKDKDRESKIIREKQLGSCINDHITNEKIKVTARGASYIGNDETHYTKKWIDKDIQDLKKFISLTVHWIEAELATDKMQKEMGL